ncbi:MAG: iron hydrogenase, partial [Erysipelotrichia bacterium]|nr:iron hydrogenase [Erysipelotrichia bacterium]
NLASEDIVRVALTPCTAKKAEIKRDEMVSASVHLGKEKQYDVDHVITTRELALWMKANNLDLENVGTSDYDSLMPRGSGAGVIFGNTGGVMEAALRTAYYMLCKKQPNADLLTFEAARGMENVKEGMVNIDGLKLRVAIIHTLDALRKFVQTKKLNDYHFIEVMCCPGGCIGGGGQPKAAMGMSDDIRLKRIAGLYSADEQSVVRNSHDNEAIKKVYEHFYGQPLSSLAEKLLHTTYQDRSTILNEDPAKYHYQEESTVDVQAKTSMQVAYQCSVCGYIYDGKDFNAELDSYVCPICNVPKQLFDEIAVETTLKQKEEVKTKQWVCSICGYVCDGENFAAEPDSYVCPICTVPKTMFEER